MKRVALICLMILMYWGAPRVAAQSSAGETRTATETSEARPESGGEDEKNQFKHSPSVQWLAEKTGWSPERVFDLSVIANFAVIAFAIIWLSKKNLPGVFRNRNSSIQRAMQEARRASEEARQRLSQIETRLSRLDAEINEMRGAVEKEAAADEQRIRASAEGEAHRIAGSAGEEIAAAAKAARRELTAYAAELAISLATQQIRVDGPTDQSLVRHFSENLARANGAPGQEKK
jgi:F-type H+-transporting ATPase subunit b